RERPDPGPGPGEERRRAARPGLGQRRRAARRYPGHRLPLRRRRRPGVLDGPAQLLRDHPLQPQRHVCHGRAPAVRRAARQAGPSVKPLLRGMALAVLGLALASCSSSRAPQPVAPGSQPISGPADYNRPHRDGAPWWDVDVSRIPDAVPMPHYGRFKANPYTVMGKTYYPIQDSRRYVATGIASWYGTKFHGQATANGEAYDLYGMTAAHKTLPLPSYVRVTNLENG